MRILAITVPIFLLIAAGYAMRRAKFITDDVRNFLSKFVFYAAFPALTFRSIVSFDFTKTLDLSLVGANLATTLVMFVLSFAAVMLIRDRRKRGALHMGSFRSNQGYLGLPVVSGFYGTEAMSRAAVVNGFDSPLSVILSAVALETFGTRTGGSRLKVLGSKLLGLATNPIVLSSFLGLAFSYFRIPVLSIGIVDQLLALLAGTSLPLALLSIGCSLEIGKLFQNLRPVLAVAGAKLLLFPALAFLLSWFVFGLRGTDLSVNLVLTAMPTSVSSYIMACEMDTDEELMASIIGLTTFASILTVSLLQWALASGWIPT
jgi:predicted permease